MKILEISIQIHSAVASVILLLHKGNPQYVFAEEENNCFNSQTGNACIIAPLVLCVIPVSMRSTFLEKQSAVSARDWTGGERRGGRGRREERREGGRRSRGV